MKFHYGTNNKKIDITNIVYSNYCNENKIIIPEDDSIRAFYFGDPEFGTVKNIYIDNKNYGSKKINIYEKKILIYFTICCINNFLEISEHIYNSLKQNNELFNSIYEIRLIILNAKNDNLLKSFYNYEKINVIYKFDSNPGNQGEYITMNIIKKHSQTDDFYILYLHSKGVSDRHQTNKMKKNILSWTNYLLYFNINYFEFIYNNLEIFDVIGVQLHGNNSNNYYKNFCGIEDLISKEGYCGPSWPYHFSGNFWWSKSEYIKNIRNPEEKYPAAEFWITNGNTAKLLTLWNENINFYEEELKKSLYENKLLKLDTKYNY